MASDANLQVRRKRNWWKIAFFVLLVVFEVTREVAVLGYAEKAQPNGSGFVTATPGLVTADGSWKRIHGGGPMEKAVVRIECWQDRGECFENVVHISDQYVSPPMIDHFPATFTADAVTYKNEEPTCATYSVRIDLTLSKVFAVRDRLNNPANADCLKLERRIEMQLERSYDTLPSPLEGHFVPFFWLLSKIFG